jgi:hypothetical protein
LAREITECIEGQIMSTKHGIGLELAKVACKLETRLARKEAFDLIQAPRLFWRVGFAEHEAPDFGSVLHNGHVAV